MAASGRATERMAGALWGPFVGDAYCLGSHWIYDEAAFRERFPDGPEGFDAPDADHYHAGKAPGALTHYGEGALVLLRSLVAVGGFDPRHYGERLFAFYAAPDCRSYRDKPTRHLVQRRLDQPGEVAFAEDAALADDQNVTTSRLAPLVVRYVGSPATMLHVDRATRVLQSHDRAVAYACAHAQLLDDLLAGAELREAVDRLARLGDARTPLGLEIREMVEAVRAARGRDVDTATGRFGRACGLRQAFPAALHTALAFADDFTGAIRACCAARGDNASRAMLVGAWLGASLGVTAVPATWRQRLADHDGIAADVAALLTAAGAVGSGR